ncbi:MAG TPA: hypothetical protein PLL57_06185 [Flavobacteriales bacterium]|nr:hypothetical protein [Flavobacteriales bacterium]
MGIDRTSLAVSFITLSLATTAQVDVGPLPSAVWCAGTSFDVPFTATGTFDPGNSFIVERSDASGVFAPGFPIGSLAGDVSGTVTCSSWGAAAPGTGYLVRVRSTSPAFTSAASPSSLTLAAPNAGMDGFMTLCSNGPAFALYTALGGSPQLGGTWSDLNATGALVSGVLQLGMLTGGTYIFNYTMNEAGCTDVATVTVVLNAAPNAGTNALIAVCSTDPPFNLYQELGGTPTPGGTWQAPTAITMSGFFDPAVDPPGLYTYSVVGDPPCMSTTSTLMITVTQAPNAGITGSATYCPTDAPFTLIGQLGGSPSPGGTWTFNGVPHGAAFFPGTDVPGEYVYTLPGVSPCGNATSSVMVSLNTCALSAPVNMGIQSVAE